MTVLPERARRISPEPELLLLCARPRLDTADVAAVRDLAGGDVDWTRALRLARSHGLLPLLAWRLLEIAPDILPADVTTLLADARAEQARCNLRLAGILLALLNELRGEGIEVLPVKGPLLALDAYGDLALRAFQDLDLLIRRRDAVRAAEILGRLGFAPDPAGIGANRQALYRFGTELRLRSADPPVTVELHWEAMPRWFLLRMGFETLHAPRRTALLAGRSVETLSPEDNVVYLCAHGAKHLWRRLSWVCDIAWLVTSPRLDWVAVLDRAEQSGARRMVALALRLAGALLSISLPGEIRETVEADREAARLAESLLTDLRSFSGDVPTLGRILTFNLALRESRLDGVRTCLGRLAMPGPEDWQAFHLPRRLLPLYYAVRPLRLAVQHSRHLLVHR